MKTSTKVVFGVLLAALLAVVPASLSSASSSKADAKVKKIVLTSDNTLVLNDVVNGETVAGVITKAKELDSSGNLLGKVGVARDHIYLYVRSPGGEIQTGLEMLEALKGLNRPVDTITAFGASMAFQTVQQLGKRYITRSGVLMSHRAAGGFEGSFGGQRPSQIDSRKALWESRLDEMDQDTVNRTNGKQTLASYQKAYDNELWVTGTQAVDQGYADEVVQVSCDASLSGVTTKTINFMGLINIDYDLDNCPLNSSPMNIRVHGLTTNKGVMTMADFQAKNGGFGSACLMAAGTDANKVCATDTSLTMERLVELKGQFKAQYTNIQNRIVRNYGVF
jgi:ATP-dependent protease ClpP protease subunit